MVNYAIEEYVALLADERFKDLDYTVIKAHVSFLNDITLDQLMSAVQKHKVFFLHMTKPSTDVSNNTLSVWHHRRKLPHKSTASRISRMSYLTFTSLTPPRTAESMKI